MTGVLGYLLNTLKKDICLLKRANPTGLT